MSVSKAGCLVELFWIFSSSSSFGSVLFFSDFQCNQYIQLLLIWFNKQKKLLCLKTKTWWKMINAYDFFPHGDSRHCLYSHWACLYYLWKIVCVKRKEVTRKKWFGQTDQITEQRTNGPNGRFLSMWINLTKICRDSVKGEENEKKLWDFLRQEKEETWERNKRRRKELKRNEKELNDGQCRKRRQ